jgi:hypothetical protein
MYMCRHRASLSEVVKMLADVFTLCAPPRRRWQVQATKPVLPIRFLQVPSAEEVGIAPDKFQLWPHDLNETTKLALFPQPDDFLFDLFERGRADALAWAQQQGFPADVLQRLTLTTATTGAGLAHGGGAVSSETAAAASGGGPGGYAAANLVSADAVEVPAELRVAKRLASEQQQQ